MINTTLTSTAIEMILSQTAVYALKAVLYLAETDDAGPVRVDEIANALNVPRNYLSKILHVLTRARLLGSNRGPHGGFHLNVAASELTLAEVIDPFDGVMARSACLLGRNVCSDAKPCAAHASWKGVSSSMMAFFQDTTIDDLARREKSVGNKTRSRKTGRRK